MTDCSYEEGSVLDEDVKNDYLNSMTGFGGFESCEEKHGQDDGVLEHISSNLSSLSKNLQLMYEEMKFWSSTLVVKEGDVMIDISNSFIVWHNQMKIGWYGIFTKKKLPKKKTSHHMFRNLSMFITLW